MENLNNQTAVQPSNSMGSAIAALILFWPLGIPAIINATKVNSLWAQGQYEAAHTASAKAAKFGRIGVIVGVALQILNILYVFLYFIIMLIAELQCSSEICQRDRKAFKTFLSLVKQKCLISSKIYCDYGKLSSLRSIG